jgi:hypothetical protein
MLIRLCALVVAIASTTYPIAAQAAPVIPGALSPAQAVTIDQLLRDPAAYDGKHVAVSGKISALRQRTSAKGYAYSTFELCSPSCVHVFTFGHPKLEDGQQFTVRGMFSAVHTLGGHTYKNEIQDDESPAVAPPPPPPAQSVTIGQLLRDPVTYDGKHIAVSGKVSALQQMTSAKGNAYERFQVCSPSCIHVFTFGHPKLKAGQQVTVRGTFSAVRAGGGHIYKNEIQADANSL